MRTTVEIDGKLVAEAMRLMGSRTRKAAVEEALRRAIQIEKQRDVLELRGIGWYGDLTSWRREDGGEGERPPG